MSFLTALILAFGGGIVGALFGGTSLFIFIGLLVLVGSGIALVGGGDTFLLQGAFGPALGPHVSFVGGVAAAAFYGRHRQTVSQGQEYVESSGAFVGSDIVTPLFKMHDPLTLLVGGIFGTIGYAVFTGLALLKVPFDPSATTVTIMGITARLLFGQSGMLGRYPATEKRYDLSSNHLLFTLIWAVGLSLLTYQLVTLTKINIIVFGISAFSLLILYFGLQIPVSHHITLVAGIATLTFHSLLAAVIFGVIATFLGNFFQRTFNTYVDSHVDNSAFTIFTGTFLINLTVMLLK